MNTNIKTGAVIVGALLVSVVVYTLVDYSAPLSITGKISNVTFFESKFDPGLTRVTFDDGRTVYFQGVINVILAKNYTFTYHKTGLLWDLFGDDPVYVIDRVRSIG